MEIWLIFSIVSDQALGQRHTAILFIACIHACITCIYMLYIHILLHAYTCMYCMYFSLHVLKRFYDLGPWLVVSGQHTCHRFQRFNYSRHMGCRHCSVDPAAQGSSPKHAIYTFSFIVFVLYLSFEKNENRNKKRPGLAHFFKKNYSRHTHFIWKMLLEKTKNEKEAKVGAYYTHTFTTWPPRRDVLRYIVIRL